jgi:hypothetical protein
MWPRRRAQAAHSQDHSDTSACGRFQAAASYAAMVSERRLSGNCWKLIVEVTRHAVGAPFVIHRPRRCARPGQVLMHVISEHLPPWRRSDISRPYSSTSRVLMRDPTI